MTDRQLNNHITKLQGIEVQMKELEAQAEANFAPKAPVIIE